MSRERKRGLKFIRVLAGVVVMLFSLSLSVYAAGVAFIDTTMTSDTMDADVVTDVPLEGETVILANTLTNMANNWRIAVSSSDNGEVKVATGAGENNGNALVLSGDCNEASQTRAMVFLSNTKQGTKDGAKLTNEVSFLMRFNAAELADGAYAKVRYALNENTTYKQKERIDIYIFNNKFVFSGNNTLENGVEYYYTNDSEWHELVIYNTFRINTNAYQIFMDDNFVTYANKYSNSKSLRAVSVHLEADAMNSDLYISRIAGYYSGKSDGSVIPKVDTTNFVMSDINGEMISGVVNQGTEIIASGMSASKNTASYGYEEYMQWAYSDTENGIYRTIPGATDTSYVPGEEYAGKYVKFRYVVRDTKSSDGSNYPEMYAQTFESSPVLVIPEDKKVYMPSSVIADGTALSLLKDGQTITPKVCITNYGDALDDYEYRLFAALYNNGKLESVKISDGKKGLAEGENYISTDDIAFNVSEGSNIGDYTLKLFVWNSAEGLVPVWDGYDYHNNHRIK